MQYDLIDVKIKTLAFIADTFRVSLVIHMSTHGTWGFDEGESNLPFVDSRRGH